MAYGDLGALLPTESQYGSPQSYTEEIRGEAQQRATYLSQMDQYYAQLEESKRQFDLNYAAREKEFEWTSGFQERQFEHQSELDTRRFGLEERKANLEARIAQKQIQFQNAQLAFERQRIKFEEDKLKAELKMMNQNISIERQKMDLQKQLGLGQLGLEQRRLDSETKLAQQKFGLEEYLGQLQGAQMGFSNQLQLMQTQLGMQQAFPYGVQTARGGVGQYPQYQSANDYFKNQLQSLSRTAGGNSLTYNPSGSSNNTSISSGTYMPTSTRYGSAYR